MGIKKKEGSSFPFKGIEEKEYLRLFIFEFYGCLIVSYQKTPCGASFLGQSLKPLTFKTLDNLTPAAYIVCVWSLCLSPLPTNESPSPIVYTYLVLSFDSLSFHSYCHFF